MALYKQHKKATKRACIDLLERDSQCVILASNPNLTEEIYNNLKRDIEAIPKAEYDIVIDSVNVDFNGIVFLTIQILNIRNIIAKISPNLEIANASISSTVFIGKIKEKDIHKFKMVIMEDLNFRFPLKTNNFCIIFNLPHNKYEVFFFGKPEKMALTPEWLQLVT